MTIAMISTSFVILTTRLDAILSHPMVYPCVLLVHTDIAALSRVAAQIEEHYGWPRLSVGSRLSQELLPVLPKHRPRSTQRIMQDLVGSFAPGPILWVDVDLLFEPSLALDPLKLMKDCSRQTPAVVMWPGAYENRALSYAVPEHAHYRTWSQPDLCSQCIIAL